MTSFVLTRYPSEEKSPLSADLEQDFKRNVVESAVCDDHQALLADHSRGGLEHNFVKCIGCSYERRHVFRRGR